MPVSVFVLALRAEMVAPPSATLSHAPSPRATSMPASDAEPPETTSLQFVFSFRRITTPATGLT